MTSNIQEMYNGRSPLQLVPQQFLSFLGTSNYRKSHNIEDNGCMNSLPQPEAARRQEQAILTPNIMGFTVRQVGRVEIVDLSAMGNGSDLSDS